MSENSLDLSILLLNAKPLTAQNATQDAAQNIQSFFKKMPIRFEMIFVMSDEDLRRASGALIVVMDAELKVPLAEIISFMTHFHADPSIQMIIGDRYAPRKNGTPVRPKSLVLNLTKKLFKIEAVDIFCPFKAFRKNVADKIMPFVHLGLTLDVEILLKAQQQKINIQSLPVFSRPIKPVSRLKLIFRLILLFLNRSTKE